MTLETAFYGSLLVIGSIVAIACFLIWFMPSEELNDVLNVKGDSHEAN